MKIHKHEKGQSIVLIIISMIGLIAMSALIIDGGNAYLKRRNAQTAADAAAWAGAYEKCVNKGLSADILAAITQYAVTENNATSIVAWDATDDVEVTVDVVTSTFFAKVFGQPTTTVVASAKADCFAPAAADHVLPIAWTCRPPGLLPSDSSVCLYKSIPWPTMKQLLNNSSFTPTDPDSGLVPILYHDDSTTVETAASYLGGPSSGDLQLYIIMDSLSSSEDIPCYPNGTLDCDLDDDGRFDVLGQGDRSWLILDGDANNAQLDDIVRSELSIEVSRPTWYPGRDGAIADVYKDALDYVEGTPALIPVFESFCAPTSNPLTDTLCASLVQSGDGLVQISTAASGTYYRVVAFAEFYVSCVSNKPNKDCPGKEMAVAAGLTDHNTPSIEGYFIEGWVADSDKIATNNSIDLGVYVISLTE